ncbi:transporter [Pseudorhodobacter turbinis]|uniref:Transporter n=1 Tax=Pseudorhodobacter turbinis TaxID=2500533 RepID=A0A4P8ECU1_9RHOB|nr:transporter [Pseudorhodobacter turbinis]QCO54539.1 transporter [Pseudorhodobacter turbinis]
MPPYLILAGIVLCTAYGDYALKYASLKPSPLSSSWFAGGAGLYAITAAGWLFLMQSHNLAQIGVLYSAATILTLTLVGYLFFDESLSSRQVIGLSAAMLSVFLMKSEA